MYLGITKTVQTSELKINVFVRNYHMQNYLVVFYQIKLQATFFFTRMWSSSGLPQQAEVAQGVPGRLRPQIFLTFGTTRVVGCQPYAPAAFTPEEIPGTHF